MQAKGDNQMEEAQPNAATRVFGITELAEQIIQDLPLRQLLTIQRVCSSFRDVVQGSSELKKRLYLKPSQSTTMTLLPSELEPPHISRIVPYRLRWEHDSIIVIDVDRNYQNCNVEESWRKMQVASPPIAYGRVAVYRSRGDVATKNLRSADGGLTLGDLADAVHRLRQGYQRFKRVQCILYADRGQVRGSEFQVFRSLKPATSNEIQMTLLCRYNSEEKKLRSAGMRRNR